MDKDIFAIALLKSQERGREERVKRSEFVSYKWWKHALRFNLLHLKKCSTLGFNDRQGAGHVFNFTFATFACLHSHLLPHLQGLNTHGLNSNTSFGDHNTTNCKHLYVNYVAYCQIEPAANICSSLNRFHQSEARSENQHRSGQNPRPTMTHNSVNWKSPGIKVTNCYEKSFKFKHDYSLITAT